LKHCKFRTSFGGVLFCQDPPYLEGFCKFHHEAFRNGELNENAVINEQVSDQDRRRQINYHGIRLPAGSYRVDRT